MSYRYVPKRVIALIMSVMLLFSSLGVLIGPSNQAVAASSTGPSSIREWLPAPGQFTNEAGWGGTGDINVKWTNTPGSAGVSLGAFGGSIVFKFDDPIQNSSLNPYGVDFTVFGNAFAGNEEPAGVAVAQDDGTGNPGPWYYIAGSEHYEDSTIWDYQVTYTNPEPEFTTANGVKIPWTDNKSVSGNVYTNTYHKHSYYPIPANYPSAPIGFNNLSQTYTGVKISVKKNAFGYPDTHANGNAPYDVPVNPYLTSPTKGDPIDISWAVDSLGKPVSLNSISYVRVFNAVQMDGGALGEIGAEITSLQRVTANQSVSETADLSSIVLSGTNVDSSVTKQITVTAGVYEYNDILINADKIKLTANGTASNIFINNKSGTTGTLIDKEIPLSETTPKIVRVIAQDGLNTPKIYYLSIRKGLEEVNKSFLNAAITNVDNMQKGNYTDASWQALQNSLAAAKLISASSTVLQDQVDVALSDLLAAVQGLQINAPPETPQQLTVSVSISGYSAVAGKSVTLAKTDTQVEEGKTAAYAINKLTSHLNVINTSGNFITSIGGLAIGDGGPKSSWMYLVNGQFADVGIADYVLKSSDIITLVYTDDYEEDITKLADKTALNSKINELKEVTQGNYTEASWSVFQKSLTLAKEVAANSYAIQYHATSALSKLTSAFQSLVTTTSPPEQQTISVSFTLNGHSAVAVGKDVSLPKTTIQVESGKTAAYVIFKVLTEAGIHYEGNGGSYISKVKDLGEFDGGPKSGWLYSVDGVDPNVGIASYILTKNADIVLRYTDNFELENPTTPGGGTDGPSGGNPSAVEIQTAIDAASNYFTSKASGISSEWTAIGLARTGHKLPETYYHKLQNNVTYSQGDFSLVTDLERTILGITVSGGDATNVSGINLIAKLYNSNKMTDQGINGVVFALLALDSKNYSVPQDAIWTREVLINEIISRQHADGGFALSSGASDPDITAMVLTALAPYVDNQALLSANTITKTINWLSQHQESNGGYLSWGVDSSESVSQAIIALTSNQIDPTNAKYTKNGVNLLDKLFQFRLADGSFSHSTEMRSNGMATEQALQALAAYKLYKEGKGDRLYDFTKALPGLDQVSSSPVSIRVEGPEGRIAQGTVTAATPLQALDSLATAKGIEVKKEVKWGTLDLNIAGIHSSFYGDEDYGSWDFAIHRGNKWLTSYQGTSDQIILKASDEVIFFYNNYATMPIDSISIEPAKGSTVYEDVNFTVRVNKTEMDYSNFGLTPVAAAGVNVAIYTSTGDLVSSQKTDALGATVFGHLPAGNYTVSISDYVANSAPNVVHTTIPLQVQVGLAPTNVPLPTGDNQPTIEIPAGNQDYIIPVTDTDAAKEVTIQIPDDSQSKVYVSLPTGSSLPQIKAVKGNVTMVIPQGAQVTSGDTQAVELVTSKNANDAGVNHNVSSLVTSGKKLDSVDQVITIGGGSIGITFDQFVTVSFAGMKGKEAAYIQNGVPSVIQKFASDTAGAASGKNEYAYDSGNDLIVKTKHFTDFVAYTSSAIAVTPNPGGGYTPPVTKHVKLSVDKLTISKGYVIPEVSVELQTGDTAWSVLKRVLDTRGTVYKFKWTEEYGSVYVQSIDGDGEFDHGSKSGWMYNVNGTYPGIGASNTVLKDGDSVQWRYTTNLGKDLENEVIKKPTIVTPVINSGDKKPVIDVPATIEQDYILNITKELQDKELITINIPNVTPKIILNLDDVKDGIPAITAIKDDISLTIDKGTVLNSGDSNVGILTALNAVDKDLQELVNKGLSSANKKLVKLHQAFAMGNTSKSVLFDRPVTLVLKGAKGQQVGFIEGNAFTPIEIYGTEAEGIEATKGKEKITYAFVQDNNLIIKTNHFTSFVSYTSSEGTAVAFDLNKLYNDVKSISNWALDAIREATQKALVEGSNGQFSPQATVTRAEFTKMLVGVLGLDVQTVKVINFKDVAQDDWFYTYVNAAYKAGLITGTSADQFSPNEKLTREQMAVIMVNALKLPTAGNALAIDDLEQVSDWAKASVQSVIAQGLISGWDNRFHPIDEVTREMATVVAMRAYHSINDPK
ncbi:DUF4430 domain-containing protein [Paenibacillus plantarum]|nr:DUF4430 domain-containing protein [Paenibacillus plantarum]